MFGQTEQENLWNTLDYWILYYFQGRSRLQPLSRWQNVSGYITWE